MRRHTLVARKVPTDNFAQALCTLENMMSYYTVHRDKIDPRTDPLGHLLLDAPEYLVGILSSVSVGKQVSDAVYIRRKAEGRNQRIALCDAITAGYLAGSAAGMASYIASNAINKIKRSI